MSFSRTKKWLLGISGAAALTVGLAAPAMAGTHPTPSPTQRALPIACRAFPGSNTLTLTAGGHTFRYQTRLALTPTRQRGVLVISGTLCDTYEPTPTVFPVHGVLFGNDAVYSVNYGGTSPQGTRTFSGIESGPFGHIAVGHYSETGPEGLAGLFSQLRL